MLVDAAIVAFVIVALVRGKEIGFARQFFSTIGFFGGLYLGALLQHYTVTFVRSGSAQIFVTLLTTIGTAVIFMAIGEYIGLRIKRRAIHHRINRYDNAFGSLLSVATMLISIWLIAAIAGNLPFYGLQSLLSQSRIVAALEGNLPNAPNIISGIGKLVDPNGFPEVFIGTEPAPNRSVNLTGLGEITAAVQQDKASVVKIEGKGCGGVVEGSGFIVGANLVATNAHVVAGIAKPMVEDSSGGHGAAVIWFDPNLDFAVLRVPNLSGNSLVLSKERVNNGTLGAAIGYPGGGDLNAQAAAILNRFQARGRDIYGRGNTLREVYEIQANIIPGNSGGPLILKDGTVAGIVFAESTTYDHIGYALTSPQISDSLAQAVSQNRVVATGRCAE